MKLHKIAHARAGDKGEIVNISLIPYREEDYEFLRQMVTPELVQQHFKEIATGGVKRYELPNIRALNFVLYGTRPGGVSAAVDIDVHGKSLSWALLEIEVDHS
jgi:hypothetical protein